MRDSTMNDEYEDEDERFAVCSSQWDRRNKQSADSASDEWMKAEAAGQLVGVDREAGIIYGYVVAQEGPFKSEGRGEFDHKSLRMILGLAKAEKAGLKSRFGHPTMSDDGIGKYLGRAKKPRLDKIIKQDADGKDVEIEVVRADLHLDPSSFDTPFGNLGNYVLDRAESDPASFSSSLVLTTEMEYRLEKGKPKTDDQGKELPPLWRPTALHASDVVDTGEAVDAFLSPDSLPDGIVRRGCELLDKQFHGKSRQFVREHCQRWLDRYLDRRYGPEPVTTPTIHFDPPGRIGIAFDPMVDEFFPPMKLPPIKAFESPPRDDRRLGRLEMSPDLVANMTSGVFRVVQGALPKNVKVVRAGYERDRDVFQIILCSPDFDAVSEGGVVPLLSCPWIERLSAESEPAPENVVVSDSAAGEHLPPIDVTIAPPPYKPAKYDPAADPTIRRMRNWQERYKD